MKRYLNTLIKDIIVAAIVLFFVYAVMSYVEADDYLIKNVVKPAAEKMNIDTEALTFSYTFPFKLKAEGINIGRKSLVKEASIYISPAVLMKREGIYLFQLNIEDSILYWDEMEAFLQRETEGTSINVNIFSLRLKNIYIVFDERKHVKINEASLSLKSSEDTFELRIRDLDLSQGDRVYKFLNSRVKYDGKDYVVNILGNSEDGEIKIKGTAGNTKSDLAVKSRALPFALIDKEINGVFDIQGKMTGGLKKPEFRGRIRTQDVKYRNIDLNDGAYTVNFKDNTLSVPHMELNSGGGAIEGNVRIAFQDDVEIRGSLDFRDIDARKIWHWIQIPTRLDGQVVFHARETERYDFDGEFRLVGLEGSVGNDDIRNGELDFIKEGDLIHINRCYSDLGKGYLNISGDYYKDFYNFEAEVHDLDLEKIYPNDAVKGLARLKGVLNKDESGINFIGFAELDNAVIKEKLVIDEMSAFVNIGTVWEVQFNYRGMHGDDNTLSEKGSGEIAYVPGRSLSARDTAIILWGDHEMTLDFEAEKNDGGWEVSGFRNRLSQGEEFFDVAFDRLTSMGKSLDVQGISIRSRESDVNGDFSYSEEKKISLNMNGMVDLNEINRMFRLLPYIEGNVFISCDMDQDLDLEDKGTIKIDTSTVRVNINAFEEMVYDSMEVEGTFKDDLIDLRKIDFSVDGIKTHLTGFVRQGKLDEPFPLAMKVEGDIKRVYSSFLVNFATDGVSVSSGYFSGPVKFVIDERMSLDADIRLEETELIVFSLGDIVIRDLSGKAVIKDNRIKIHEFRGFSGENGVFTVKGTIKDFIYDPVLGLDITFDDADVEGVWYFSGIASGDVSLTGKGDSVSMDGRIDVREGDIEGEFSEMFSGGGLEKEISGMNMNIRIVAKNNVWINNENADLEIKTDFYYKRSRLTGDVYFAGTLESVKGNVNFLNIPFRITSGTIYFSNSPGIPPRIDLSAESDVYYGERITVTLTITGDVNDPEILLLSDDPSLTSEDLVSLLTFNRRLEDSDGGEMFAEKMGEFATGYIQKALFKSITGNRIVDTFTLRGNVLTAEDPYLNVEVGKYISSNLFLTYRDEVIKGDSRRVDFIYYLNKNISIQTGAEEDEGKYQYNLDFRFRFKY